MAVTMTSAKALGSAGAVLPTIPLRDIVLFPRMTVPLFVWRDTAKRAIELAVAGDRRILAVTQLRTEDYNPAPNDLHTVGVTANILHFTTSADGSVRIIAEGLERMTVLGWAERQFLWGEVAPIKESRGEGAEASALMRPVLEEFAAYCTVNLSSQPYTRLLWMMPHIREPSVLADTIAPLLLIGIDQKQDLLETSDVVRRLEKIFALVKTDRQ